MYEKFSIILLVFCLTMLAGSAFAIQGTSGGTCEFYVLSEESGSYIRIKSYEGRANIGDEPLSVLGTVENKTEYDHGAYVIDVYDNATNFRVKSITWAPCASFLMEYFSGKADDYSTSIDVEFPASGEYLVRIIPIDPSEFWVNDSFYSWLSYASWEITKTDDCEVSSSSFLTGNSSTDPVAPALTICSHDSSYSELTSSEICDQGSENGHVVKDYYDIICSYCGVRIDTEEHYREETHSFNGDTCVWCGYTKETYSNYSYNETVEEVIDSFDYSSSNSYSGYSNAPSVSGNYGRDVQNYAVFWVQTQLRQTGQYYLRSAGGEHWDITGSNGDHSMQEIKRFMNDQGYSSDGSVNQTVIDAIVNYYYGTGRSLADVSTDGIYFYMSTVMSGGAGGSMSTINKGDSGSRVSWVQICLKGCGYYSDGVDGQYGNVTEAAVKRFQRDHDMVERSYVKLGTARLLLEEYYNHGGNLSNLP